MQDTPVSLLERLQKTPDPQSWERLVSLYTPLIRYWLKNNNFQTSDNDDLVQDVLGVLVRELPGFRHDLRRGAFRRWLRVITVNRVRTFYRTNQRHAVAVADDAVDQRLAQLEDPESALSKRWDEEHDVHVARRLLWLIAPEFEPATWRAFQLLVLDGKTSEEAAREVGITRNAVRIAKSRVLSRLRQELTGLVD